MISIANEVNPLIFSCICFLCDTNMCFSSNSFPVNYIPRGLPRGSLAQSLADVFPSESFIVPSVSFTQDFLVSLNTKHSCTYPPGIEHASTSHIPIKVITQNLCTYPLGIEHVGTKPLYKSKEQNTELVHISYGN